MGNSFALQYPISYTLPMAVASVFSVFSPISVLSMENQESEIKGEYNDSYKNVNVYLQPIRNNPFSRIENKITSFKALETNWDGFEADSPDDKVITNAYRFAKVLPEGIVSEITPDSIVVTPYGTIVFDFEYNSNLLSIEIGEKNIGFFSEFSDEQNLSHDGISFTPNNLPLELVSAFNRLFQ